MFARVFMDNTPKFISVPLHVCVFPEHAAKMRITLVKGHGLVLLQSLQSTAEQIFGNTKKSLEAHYLAEMKRHVRSVHLYTA